MNWRKSGLVWAPRGDRPWARTHAMAPTPLLRSNGTLRVFVTTLDDQGRGRPGYVDVSAEDPTRVLRCSERPLMDVGEAGTFDDNGVLLTSVIEPEPGLLLMYYAGFELCRNIRYRIFTGSAVSRDGGETFERRSPVPLLDRSASETYFRGGPFVLHEGGVFNLWYVAGSGWTRIGDKALPVYEIRHQASEDGLRWAPEGTPAIRIEGPDEHGFGRPWVVRDPSGRYRMFYSVRRRSLGAYRLGYAESADGLHWERKDDRMGMDVSPGGFDSKAIMYCAVLPVGGRTYCFYNGDDFGREGFAVAESPS